MCSCYLPSVRSDEEILAKIFPLFLVNSRSTGVEREIVMMMMMMMMMMILMIMMMMITFVKGLFYANVQMYLKFLKL